RNTLTQHWNGTSWSIVTSPNPGSGSSYLIGIAAVTTSDVWAVGYSTSTSTGPKQTLIEHWDGASWKILPSPSPGGVDNQLYGVAAVATSDIWGVGYFTPRSTGANQTLIEHWDGASWSVVSSPNAGSTINQLSDVAAVNATDVWAVGLSSPGQTLVEHWDGASWSIVSSPNQGSALNQLDGVAAVTASDVW